MHPSPALLGESPAIRRAMELVEQVAGRDTTVLLTGESGTGKELAARALHDRSERADRPFVAINCAAFPDTLLESQLFGHKRGAFTDARADHRGLFVEADGGTLFLDEIGDMPLSLQPKLLRVLQERRVRPVGGDREVEVDVRIVAATHRDLEAAIGAKQFREDLYYRVAVVEIDLPPLRARGNDILQLAQHFVERYAEAQKADAGGLSPDAARALLTYHWPGNVRELQNAMERAVALARGARVEASDLPPRVTRPREAPVGAPHAEPEGFLPLEEMERRYVLQVFEACERNRGRTADLLRIDRKTLYRKLKRWGVAGSDGATS